MSVVWIVQHLLAVITIWIIWISSYPLTVEACFAHDPEVRGSELHTADFVKLVPLATLSLSHSDTLSGSNVHTALILSKPPRMLCSEYRDHVALTWLCLQYLTHTYWNVRYSSFLGTYVQWRLMNWTEHTQISGIARPACYMPLRCPRVNRDAIESNKP